MADRRTPPGGRFWKKNEFLKFHVNKYQNTFQMSPLWRFYSHVHFVTIWSSGHSAAILFNVKNRHFPRISQRVIGAHFFRYGLKYSNQVRKSGCQNLVTGFKKFTQIRALFKAISKRQQRDVIDIDSESDTDACPSDSPPSMLSSCTYTGCIRIWMWFSDCFIFHRHGKF